MRIRWIGHATVLLELDGTRLLTDPILRRRIVHLRTVRPPPAPERARAASTRCSCRTPTAITSTSARCAGSARACRCSRRAEPCGRSAAAGSGAKVDSLAAGRRADDRAALGAGDAGRARPRPARRSGFSCAGSKTVYFAGDTDLFPELAGLADPLDVALVPIWGWGPTLGEGHLDPERAAEAVRLLRPRIVIPIHWGSLHPLGMSGAAFLREPPETFRRLVHERAPEVEVRLLQPGAETTVAP